MEKEKGPPDDQPLVPAEPADSDEQTGAYPRRPEPPAPTGGGSTTKSDI